MQNRDMQTELYNSIIEAADILKRKASEIVSDFSTEKISEVYVTIRFNGYEAPSMDIQKTYIPIPNKEC